MTDELDRDLRAAARENLERMGVAHRPSNLVSRLRERLITVPKPDSKPFEPTYPIVHTWTPGEKHKPGDSAGLQMINVNLAAASSVPSKFMAQEFVYAPSPLEWEAAAEIERLRGTIKHMCYVMCSPGDCQHPDCPRAAAPESRDG